jgi:hypothetical protein
VKLFLNLSQFGRIGAGAVLVHTLMEIDPQFPPVSKRQRETLVEIKQALEAQAPKGTAPDPFEQERQDDKSQEAANADGVDGQPASRPAAKPNGIDKPRAERTR